MVEHQRLSRCGAWSLTSSDQGVARALPLRCRSWGCSRCGRRMRWRLSHLIAEARPTKFVTLTSNPARHASPYAAFRAMSAALPKLVQRLRRLHADEEVEYLAVWELTKRGWPHLHIAARMPYTPAPWLKAQWLELTGASIVDIRTTTSGDDAALELAKYLTKDMHAPPGTRRFRASARFLPEPMRPRREPDEVRADWALEEASTRELALRYRMDLLDVIILDDASILAFDASTMTPAALALARQLLLARPPPPSTTNGHAIRSLLAAERHHLDHLALLQTSRQTVDSARADDPTSNRVIPLFGGAW